MSGKIKIFNDTDIIKLEKEINEFNKEHLVFATQHSSCATYNSSYSQTYFTFVVFYHDKVN